jgi:pyridoxamine 5'-phosphate oxidase
MDDLAPWRSPLSRAQHRNRSLPNARYVQLATVRPNGRPANRTVVFRGFLDQTNQLKFVTDARSQKLDQIDRCPWAEVCWYFPKTREQFRLQGHLTLVTDTHLDPELAVARIQAWADLSDAARSQFAWPHPGHPRGDNLSQFNPSPPAVDRPISDFCLLLLDPLTVDHLELRGDPHNRRLYQCQHDGWSVQEINP